MMRSSTNVTVYLCVTPVDGRKQAAAWSYWWSTAWPQCIRASVVCVHESSSRFAGACAVPGRATAYACGVGVWSISQVSAIHHIEGTCFDDELSEDVDVVELAVADMRKFGILPRRSSSVCSFTAALVERNGAQGNSDRHRSIVVPSSA